MVVKNLRRTLDSVSNYCEAKGTNYLEEYKLILIKQSGLSKSQRAALAYIVELEIKKVKDEK